MTGQRYDVRGTANRRWTVVAGVAGVLVVVVVAVLLALSRRGGDPAAPGPSAGGATTVAAPSGASSSSVGPSPTVTDPTAAAGEAAKKAFTQFIAVTDQVQANGGKNTDLLKTVAVQGALTAELNLAKGYVDNGYHMVGNHVIATSKITSVALKTDATTNAVPEVVLTACVDGTNSHAYFTNGQLVPPAASKYWQWTVNVRYYPALGGVDGWFVADVSNEIAQRC